MTRPNRAFYQIKPVPTGETAKTTSDAVAIERAKVSSAEQRTGFAAQLECMKVQEKDLLETVAALLKQLKTCCSPTRFDVVRKQVLDSLAAIDDKMRIYKEEQLALPVAVGIDSVTRYLKIEVFAKQCRLKVLESVLEQLQTFSAAMITTRPHVSATSSAESSHDSAYSYASGDPVQSAIAHLGIAASQPRRRENLATHQRDILRFVCNLHTGTLATCTRNIYQALQSVQGLVVRAFEASLPY
jgi:hypothetical protein